MSLNNSISPLFRASVLAIDFGTRRVGIAISRGTLAEPLEIVANDENLFTNLQKIIATEKPTHLIVGISENEMARKTHTFVAQLQAYTTLPIELVDETLSSNTVHRKLLTSGMKQSQRQQPIDHLAAAEFLQEWLDEQ